jgi:AAHS family 4-hydroxybenzoate transporter-like MFS transporter
VRTLLSSGYRGMTLSLWGTYFMGLLVIYLLSGWLPADQGRRPADRARRQHHGTVPAGRHRRRAGGGLLHGPLRANRVIGVSYVLGAMFILMLASGSVTSSMFAATCCWPASA